MTISEFNESQSGKFRFIEIDPYVRHNKHHVRRFKLEQFCPMADKWARICVPVPSLLNFESSNEEPLTDDKLVFSRKKRDSLISILHRQYIIVLREKYGERYFAANTTEQIGRTCLKVIQERKEEGYYQSYSEEPEQPKHKPDEFEDDLHLKNTVEKQWGNYHQKLAYHRESMRQEEEANRILSEQDYHGAKVFLEGRNGYEYEGFSIYLAETV